MKFVVNILIFLLMPLFAYGQSAEGRYVSRMTQDGTLFFINPHKLTKKTELKRFEYDVTMLSWTDSITVNFTFETNRMSVPSKFEIEVGDKAFVCNDYKPLFIDIKKNHYEIRLTSKFPYQLFKEITESPVPPNFIIWQDNVKETATYSEGAWKKERKKLSDINNIFLYTR